MSVTKFAFLPLNSAGATLAPIFLWLCAKYIPSWCLHLQHPSPCSCTSERRPPNCQTQLLGYWCQFMTVFETMQEEEIKILSPLFLITDCETSSYKLLMGGHSSWGMSLLCSPLHQLRIKATFYFLQTLSPYFLFGFTWQRKPRFWPAAILVLGYCQPCCPEKKGARVIVNSDLLWV